MTVFFMPCYTKTEREMWSLRVRSSLRMAALLLPFLLLVAALLPAATATAHAEGIQVKRAALEAAEEGYQLNADFEITLNPTLEQALKKGIVLYFVTEFDLVNPRWYWLDEKVAHSQLQEALSYYALTRQYRLSRGLLSQNFDTLEEALQILSRLRNRITVESAVLKKDTTYVATLRMRLDVSRLPKPFQVEALSSRDWNLSSAKSQWSMTLPPPLPSSTPPPPVSPPPQKPPGEGKP